MDILGWFLAFLGLGGLLFGVLQMLKMKKMNRVPHRRPSEIAQLGPRAADANGLLSTEGSAQPGQQQLFAPMSGQPCLAYEITIEAKWEKHSETENGTKKTTGSKNVHSETRGCQFLISDGMGSVVVDSTGALDASMEKSHSSEVGVGGLLWPATLRFGHMETNTPIVSRDDGHVIGFVGTEKIVKPSPTIYALGQIDAGPHGAMLRTPKGIGTGKLILSPKGRAGLLASTKRNMILGYAIGGVLAVGGTGAGLFGPKAESFADSASCAAEIAEGVVNCDDRIDSKLGKTYNWTVREPGYYIVKVKAPQVKNPIDAMVAIKTPDGRRVAEEYADGTEQTIVGEKLEAGSYLLSVTDVLGRNLKGGLGYHLSIERDASKDDVAKDAAPVVEAVAADEPEAAVSGKVLTMTAPVHTTTHGSKPKPKASAHALADTGAPPPPKAASVTPPPPPPPPAKVEAAPAPPPPPKAAPPPPKPAQPEKKGVSLEVHFP
ncbi:E3 ubiquitin ligase family protein [Pendulispora brunnea]|uniref:RING-type E3 ubiquitin transferase n=1 Tax=Pendulispora brunnea TaxID=2905690 RepID=A0ABZ2KEQ9_9BACT